VLYFLICTALARWRTFSVLGDLRYAHDRGNMRDGQRQQDAAVDLHVPELSEVKKFAVSVSLEGGRS